MRHRSTNHPNIPVHQEVATEDYLRYAAAVSKRSNRQGFAVLTLLVVPIRVIKGAMGAHL